MPKKKEHIRNFGIENPKKMPRLHQNRKKNIFKYVTICTVRYGVKF